jgi:hypothetical protein
MPMSLRGFARLLQVNESAVRQGVASGRLTPAVVGRHPDGRPFISDTEQARREWTENRQRVVATGKPAAQEVHPAIGAYLDLQEVIVEVEKRLGAAFEETVANAPDFETAAWPALDAAWAKVPDALERLMTEMKAIAPLYAKAGHDVNRNNGRKKT